MRASGKACDVTSSTTRSQLVPPVGRGGWSQQRIRLITTFRLATAIPSVGSRTGTELFDLAAESLRRDSAAAGF